LEHLLWENQIIIKEMNKVVMKELIDKAAVVAEIERLREEEYPCDTFEESTGYYNALDEIATFLNTLEVKEVDFEEIWKEYFRPAFENEIPQKPKWNENDEHHLRMCLECVEECAFQDREDFSKTIDWLKSLKQRMEEQQ